MNFIKSIFLMVSLLICSNLLARPTVSLTIENAKCSEDGIITVTAINTSGSVSYELINATTSLTVRPQQPSPIFKNLAPGNYIVAVYDLSTGVNAEKHGATILLTPNKPLEMEYPIGTNNPEKYCGANSGRVTLQLKKGTGTAPYTASITGAVYRDTTFTERPSQVIFDDLPSGVYNIKLMDACGHTRTATVTAKQTTFNATNVVLNVDDLSKVDPSIKCGNLQIPLDPEDYTSNNETFTVVGNNGSTIRRYYISELKNLKLRVEHPANSGKFSEWITTNTGSYYTHSILYDKNNPTYRVQLQHPCTGALTFSDVVTLPSLATYNPTNHVAGSYYSDNICTTPNKREYRFNLSQKSDGMHNYCIDDLAKVIAIPRGGGETIEIDIPLNRPSVVGNSKHFLIGKTYDYTFKDSNGNILKQDEFTVAPTTNDFNHVFSHSRTAYSCNFTDRVMKTIRYQCNVTGVNLFSDSITLSVLEGPKIYPPEKFKGLSHNVWSDENMPNGLYKIKIENGGCSLIKEFTVTDVTPNRWNHNIRFDGVTTPIFTGCGYTETTKFNAVAVDGNGDPLVGQHTDYVIKFHETVHESDYSGIEKQLSTSDGSGKNNIYRMEPGDYTIDIYNGDKLAPSCYYKTVSFTIPEFRLATINAAASSTITCGGGSAVNITVVTETVGTHPSKYRIKKEEDGEDQFSAWQTSNVFPSKPVGAYTVQMGEDCGYTEKIIYVLDGNQQFAVIRGETELGSGKVCKGMPIELSVISVGNIVAYEWQKEISGVWTQIASGSDANATYTITSASDADKGKYKVRINNGTCWLESEIAIVEVVEQKYKTPIIVGDDEICNGSTTILTVKDSEVTWSYQWYKDNSPIAGAIGSSLLVSEEGEYSVIIVPVASCPSDISSNFKVRSCFNNSGYQIKLFACETEIVDILTMGGFNPSSQLSVNEAPTYGTTKIENNKIVYKNTGGLLPDCESSIRKNDVASYKICDVAGQNCEIIPVYYYILERPSLILTDSCSFNPRLKVSPQYSATTYTWYHSTNGTSWTKIIDNATTTELTPPKEGIYKLEIFKDKKIEPKKGLKLKVKKKKINNLDWYSITSTVVTL